jgi:hypothetical protein
MQELRRAFDGAIAWSLDIPESADRVRAAASLDLSQEKTP